MSHDDKEADQAIYRYISFSRERKKKEGETEEPGGSIQRGGSTKAKEERLQVEAGKNECPMRTRVTKTHTTNFTNTHAAKRKFTGEGILPVDA